MNKPTLYIFSGLPGSGKTTIAKELAKSVGAAYLRIDTIEQVIRDLCDFKVEGEGYRLSYRIASDNLKIGISVIADSCNPLDLTRREWNDVAIKSNAHFINIEIICSDKHEHKRRIETRKSKIPGLKLPTWEQVENREYHPWHRHRIKIDTASKSIHSCVNVLLENILPEKNIQRNVKTPMKIFRTDNMHKHFIELTSLLDTELNARYGKQQSQYDEHNKIDPIDTAIIGYIEDIPVACGCFKKIAKDTVEIKRMYVKKNHRRKGISTTILQSLENWSTELGFTNSLLETGKGQPEAIALYRKAGYGIIENYGPYKGMDNSVCMAKLI